MRKRSEVSGEQPVAEYVVPVDTINEAVIIAAALVCAPEIRERLLVRIQPEHFLNEQHRAVWHAFLEMRRLKLDVDLATIQSIAGDQVRIPYLVELMEARPDAPTNLDFHVDALMWDRRRVQAAQGPLSMFLAALKNPQEAPDRVRALVRHLADSFEGYSDRQYIYDPHSLVVDHMNQIRKRMAGNACYPYGIPGLDYYESTIAGKRERRMVPGAAPGQVTLISGVTGSGKSSLTAHIALGLAKQGRRVVYGAWEVQAPMTLEQLACINLGINRADVLDPEGAILRGAIITHEHLIQLEEEMHKISKLITFFKNPFRRSRGEKKTNDANLDLVQSILSDTACDVFIADLWRRCLVSIKPEHEEDALFRQQAMLEEMGIHGILVHQQRHKDVELRSDRRPTREGIKGSGAYLEITDTMFGTHRDALYKDVIDDSLEVCVLKQRLGKAPLGVSFAWSPEHGSIQGGKSIKYEHVLHTEETSRVNSKFKSPRKGHDDR
jgi:replicative DNA helicase